MAIVTVYVDASVCPETGAAGWGAWIRRGETSATRGGVLRGGARDSGEAEMAAAANGIACAAALGAVGPGDLLVLVSDSTEVWLKLFGASGSSGDTRCGRMIAEARRCARDGGFRVRVNKVKAHSTRDGARSWANRAVDAEAKRHMRAARDAAHPKTAPEFRVPAGRGTALEAVAAMSKSGECGRFALRRAVESVAALERGASASAWARSCGKLGLAAPWGRNPAESERQAAYVTPEDVASHFMGRPDPAEAVMRAVAAGDFPDDIASCRAAALPPGPRAGRRAERPESARDPAGGMSPGGGP